MEKHINICDIHDWAMEENGLNLIKKLMDFGALPTEKERMCDKCKQPMSLRIDNSVIDKYKWYCGNKVSIRKQKSTTCRYTASIRKGTFFL